MSRLSQALAMANQPKPAPTPKPKDPLEDFMDGPPPPKPKPVPGNPLDDFMQEFGYAQPPMQMAGDVIQFPGMGPGLRPDQLQQLRQLQAQHGLSDEQLKYLLAVVQQGGR